MLDILNKNIQFHSYANGMLVLDNGSFGDIFYSEDEPEVESELLILSNKEVSIASFEVFENRIKQTKDVF